MSDSVISEGINVLAFGMGTVFIFLILLVLTTQLMTFFINAFFFSKEGIPDLESSESQTNVDPDIVQAIKKASTYIIKRLRAKCSFQNIILKPQCII